MFDLTPKLPYAALNKQGITGMKTKDVFNLMTSVPRGFDVGRYMKAAEAYDTDGLEQLVTEAKLNPTQRRWLANMNTPNKTPLATYAVETQNLRLLKFLLDEQADPFVIPNGAIFTAVAMQDVEALDMICAKPKNQDDRDIISHALISTIPSCNAELCRTLVKHGADLTMYAEEVSQTALYAAAVLHQSLLREGDDHTDDDIREIETIVSDLVSAGANPHQSEGNLGSAFEVAAHTADMHPDGDKILDILLSKEMGQQSEALMKSELGRISRGASPGRLIPST